jgi:UDP-glucose 4-epimerase
LGPVEVVVNGVLVTGGMGYIGSHFCKEAIRQGLTPIVVDTSDSRPYQDQIFYKMDIASCTIKFLRDIRSKYNIKQVYHFAASKSAPESVVDPMAYYNNNVIAATKFLTAIAKAGYTSFINSSSAAVYGSRSLSSSEREILHPASPYGKSKMIFEMIVEDICPQHKIKYMNLRYFNVSGADPEIKYIREPIGSLVDKAIEAAITKEPFHVYGNSYRTKDGTPVRDIVHVKDVVHANLLSGLYLEGDGRSNTLNVGTGVESSVLDVLYAMTEVSGRKIKVTELAPRSGDVPLSLANCSEIKKILSFEAKNDLKTICTDHYNWVTNKA